MTDLTLITSTDPTAATHPAWPAFQRAMRGLEYKPDALRSRWHWFRDGWDAKISQMRVQASNEWCDAW